MDSPVADKEWASKYLLDPLTDPEPSQETGPGSHFTSSVAPASKTPAVTSTVTTYPSPPPAYPTPPPSASPTQPTFHPSNPWANYRHSVYGSGYSNGGPSRRSHEESTQAAKERRRRSSLGERFPGDMSHRPLDQLRKETKTAYRAPHLRKRHMPGADVIDALDKSMGVAYHHEGPYDATLRARNMNTKTSPVEALRTSNAEALRATPRENIRDALDRHMPLQGTAVIPPGFEGPDGKPMQYEEGADLMREPDAAGGAYKRWEGVTYLPDDLKGKGEPSFRIEKALKDHEANAHRRVTSDGASAYEMQTPKSKPPPPSRQHSADSPRSAKSPASAGPSEATGSSLKYAQFENEMRRSNTTGRQVGAALKRRLGSLRKSFIKSTID